MRVGQGGTIAVVAVVAAAALAAGCGSDSDEAMDPQVPSDAPAMTSEPVEPIDDEDNAPGGDTSETVEPSEPIEVIDIQELNDKRQGQRELQIVDVRTAEEVAMGTIPDSIHIPHDVIDAGDTTDLDLNAPIAVICRSGRRATIAGEALARAGASEIKVVRPGGVGTWTEAGYPTVIP